MRGEILGRWDRLMATAKARLCNNQMGRNEQTWLERVNRWLVPVLGRLYNKEWKIATAQRCSITPSVLVIHLLAADHLDLIDDFV